MTFMLNMKQAALSIEGDDLLAFEDFDKAANIEVSTCDHKASNSSCIDRFLALLLELEGNFILDVLLDRL